MRCRSFGGSRQFAFRKRTLPPSNAAVVCHRHYTSVADQIKKKVDLGELSADRIQLRASKRLDRLLEALTGYSNLPIVESWHQAQIERIREQRRKEQQKQEEMHPYVHSRTDISNNDDQKHSTKDTATSVLPRIPRGLYLHGSVGTGKSMLMDTFFDMYSKRESKGRRVHFHAFMNELHQRIHDVRKQKQVQSAINEHKAPNAEDDVRPEEYISNPVQHVALQMATETTVLCLDELQVTDVGNAYILSQLLEILLTLGTVVVATSNQPPDNLSSSYQGSTDMFFSSFLALLQRHCIIHHLDSDVDYRTLPSLSNEESMYLLSDDDDRQSHAERMELITEDLLLEFSSDPFASVDLSVGFQRHITVQGTGVGQFTFDELCRDNDYGTLEFRAIARNFPFLVLKDIPILDLTDMRDIDPARRFVILMDELYEARGALLCSSVVMPNDVFASVPSAENFSKESKDDWTMDSDTLIGDVERVRRDKSHAYRRAISRLTEMTSRKWWDRVFDKFSLASEK
jgi:protein AFG1